MASVIGDFVTGHAYLPTMIATTTIQHQHSREASHYRSSRSREPLERRSSASPRFPRSSHTPSTRSTDHQPSPSSRDRERDRGRERDRERELRGQEATIPKSSGGGASRFPSPPNSSSPSTITTPAQTQNVQGTGMASEDCEAPSDKANAVAPAPAPPPSQQQQPSPTSDDFPMADADADADPYHTPGSSSAEQTQGQTIRVRDLAHIQSLARADLLTGNGPGILNDPPLQQMKYDISGMPINDIIEMVAALLTKITSTNDLQHDAIQRNVTHQQQANQNSESGSGSQMSPLSTSVLAFHGKNVPAITILSYLSRIHRYCPTTYEVFLSLLVYFDRMTERVNEMVMKNEEAKRLAALNPIPPASSVSSSQQPLSQAGLAVPAGPVGSAGPTQPDELQEDAGDSDSVETDSDLADEDEDEDEEMGGQERRSRRRSSNHGETGKVISGAGAPTVATGPATYFVVDSFNIHRLIIAGVTCASKFFSDVFYTNSRYAKVGGLPLAELNHLELQFLLLNDFQLFVPVEDLEAYATMLVEFYAREIVAQRSQSSGLD